jgi:uncharacterized repeat protein (TIGR03803 family)/autotransporter-associated beta strand protein
VEGLIENLAGCGFRASISKLCAFTSAVARAGILILLWLVVSPASAQTLTNLLGFYPYGTTSGTSPQGSLTLCGSTLYGTTINGGDAYDYGVVFSINTDGTSFQRLCSFSGTDGHRPNGGLILAGSTLYGTTPSGGANQDGNVFSLPVGGGTATTLCSFNGTNGFGPEGGLAISGSTLYGTVLEGVFSIPVTGGTLTTLVTLNGETGSGYLLYGGLTLSGSTLYGTTAMGGTGVVGNQGNGYGTVFRINTDGTGFHTLFSFSGTNGYQPMGSLILSGSTLYGTTSSGGPGWNGTNWECGTVFKINTDGTGFQTLLTFSGTNGMNPGTDLALNGSTLYGTTFAGGPGYSSTNNGNGTVFSIHTNGTGFQTLFSFSGSNGFAPEGGLAISGSTLYGTTSNGGPVSVPGGGTVFALYLPPTWTGTASGNWNTAEANWQEVGVTTTYSDGSPVAFDDTSSGSSITIHPGGVNPTGVTFNNNTVAYSFGGGPIAGTTGLVLNGSGTVTLANSNSYTGGTSVNNGVLVAENASAIPSGSLLSIGASGSVVLGTPGYAEPLGSLSGGGSAGPLGSQSGMSGGAAGAQPVGPVQSVPEPSSLALLAAGAAGLAAYGWRRRVSLSAARFEGEQSPAT